MRELQTDDMYILSEIADKMELELPKFPFIDSKKNKNKDKDELKNELLVIQKEYGLKVITLIVRKMYKAKNEINQLIAAVFEKSVDEVKKMPIKESIKAFSDILRQPGVMDFFK